MNVPHRSPTAQPGREGETKVRDEHQRHIEAVLELQHRVAPQVGDVREIELAAGIIPQHPADVREPEAALRRVGIAVVVIDVQVMRAMAARPAEHAVLQGHGAEHHI